MDLGRVLLLVSTFVGLGFITLYLRPEAVIKDKNLKNEIYRVKIDH